jgi:hypothetical protein
LKANIYNFFDRALPEFLKKGDLVYHQPTTSISEDNLILAASTITGKKLVVDQSTVMLQDFLHAYYQFLEETTYGHDIIKNWERYRDIDTRLIHNSVDYFLNRFKYQYLPNIPSLVNTSYLIPTKLDVFYFKKEYLSHLLNLSGQKRYDRFKKTLSDYQIEEIVNELADQPDEKKRILYVFTDFESTPDQSRIIAACLLSIDTKAGIAEAAISIEDGRETKLFVKNFILQCMVDVKQYYKYLEFFYVNYFTDDTEIRQYAHLLGSNNSIHLIENDSRYFEFNLFNNEQSYEIYFDVDTTKTYRVLFNFETNTDIVIDYEFVRAVPADYKIISKEKSNFVKVDTIDGGDSYESFTDRIHGFTSNVKIYPNVVNGGASFELSATDTIKLPKKQGKIKILGETYYIQTLDVMDERWPVDDTIHHLDLTSTVRFYGPLPDDIKEYPSVFFTDGTVSVGPIHLFEVETNSFKVKSYELVNHFTHGQKLYAIFNKPIKTIKLKATVLTGSSVELTRTFSKGVLSFTKNDIYLFPEQEKYDSIQNQVDVNGYFVENNSHDKLPNDYDLNYEMLIKHIKEFYLAKSSQTSYEFIFKLLFNENIDMFTPKTNMLITSDFNFTKEHVCFTKDIFDLDLSGIDFEDCILYGLTVDNNIISYGQLLSASKTTIQYNIEFPKFEILRIGVYNSRDRNVDSFFRIVINGDERMDYFIDGKIPIQIYNVVPSMFNGYFIGEVESRNEIKVYAYYTDYHWYDNYEFGGILMLDDRLYRPETFICFRTMVEFLEIDYDNLKNYGIVDQKNQVTYFPVKLKADKIVDPSLLEDDNMIPLPLNILDVDGNLLTSAELVKYVVERNKDVSNDIFYYMLLKINSVFTDFISIDAIEVIFDKYNTIIEKTIKDCVMLSDTLSGSAFEKEHWKKYDYSEGDRLVIFDNHNFDQSSAIISSINEVTKKITAITFENSLPIHRYRTYLYDSQQAIDKDFERMGFEVGLDTVLVEIADREQTETGIIITTVDPIDSIIIGTEVEFDIRANGMPTIVDLHHADIDEVKYDLLNCNNAPHLAHYDKIINLTRPVYNANLEDVTLTGFIQDEYHIVFNDIYWRQIFYKTDYMTYDEALADEEGNNLEGWCRAYFSDKAYNILDTTLYDRILSPIFESSYKDALAFPEFTDFLSFAKDEERYEELFQLVLPYREQLVSYIKTWKQLIFSNPNNIEGKVYLFYDPEYLLTTNFKTHIFDLVYEYVLMYNTDKKFPIVIDNLLYKKLEIINIDPSPYISYGNEKSEYLIDEEIGPIAFADSYSIGSRALNFFYYGPFIKGITNDFIDEIKINYLSISMKYKPIYRLPNKYINTTGLNKSCLQDNFYYQMFSYEIGCDIPIDRYRYIINSLLHPIGTKMFGRTIIFNSQNVTELTHSSGSLITAKIRNTDFPVLVENNAALFANERDFISYDDEYTEKNYG